MSGAHFNNDQDINSIKKHEVKIMPLDLNSSNYHDSNAFGGAKLQKNTQADMVSDGELDNGSGKKDSFDHTFNKWGSPNTAMSPINHISVKNTSKMTEFQQRG